MANKKYKVVSHWLVCGLGFSMEDETNSRKEADEKYAKACKSPNFYAVEYYDNGKRVKLHYN